MKDKSNNDQSAAQPIDTGDVSLDSFVPGVEAVASGENRENRRRLLKGIVASAPVIASVASRPVLAARNCTESGQLSGNASGPDDECGGEGCTPGYWKNHLGQWCQSYPPSATFYDVFGVILANDSSITLEQVITFQVPNNVTCQHPHPPDLIDNITRVLAYHAVAALQNACTSVAYDLTVTQVITSVQNAIGSGDCSTMEQLKDTLDYLNNQGCPW